MKHADWAVELSAQLSSEAFSCALFYDEGLQSRPLILADSDGHRYELTDVWFDGPTGEVRATIERSDDA